jgi:hypothetical protein
MNPEKIARAANTLRNTADHVERVARESGPWTQWQMARDAWAAYKEAANLYREAARTPSNTTTQAQVHHWHNSAERVEQDAADAAEMAREADRQLHHAISTTNEQAERMGR